MGNWVFMCWKLISVIAGLISITIMSLKYEGNLNCPVVDSDVETWEHLSTHFSNINIFIWNIQLSRELERHLFASIICIIILKVAIKILAVPSRH